MANQATLTLTVTGDDAGAVQRFVERVESVAYDLAGRVALETDVTWGEHEPESPVETEHVATIVVTGDDATSDAAAATDEADAAASVADVTSDVVTDVTGQG